MSPRHYHRIVFSLSIFLFASFSNATPTLQSLTPKQSIHGFRTVARFLNDANAPMGARFQHEQTGFTFDVLFIPSVPQGSISVRTLPTSDKGEPHTQEHLLLGKGNKGKYVANLEGMTLEETSAYTEQWHTCYHMHTIAGPDVFFRVLKEQLDALLHPDYSDEEIRREVCNFGVTEDPATHALRLEEKGTVYNEMVSTYERPWSRMERAMGILVYGDHHPFSWESGGLPSALRTMTPEDIRKFHAKAYHLYNMEMVASFAPDVALDSVLLNMNDLLTSLKDVPREQWLAENSIPLPTAAPSATIQIAEYPDHNDRRPSPIEFTWPANRLLDPKEKMLIDLFVASIAGDATTNLYKMFIDTKTRVKDIGANDVYGWVSDDSRHPVSIGFGTVDPKMLTTDSIAELRGRIVDEIVRIAALPATSPELKEFNDRVRSRVVESRRSQNKFVNSPPGFGFRGGSTGSEWRNRLQELVQWGEFDVRVTMADELAFVDSVLASKNNPWKEFVAKWKLDSVPYAVAAKPSPALLQKEEADRMARIAAEVERLKKEYGVSSDAEAITRYRNEYDRNSAVIDSITQLVPRPKFIDNPPMTLDDNLKWNIETVPPMSKEDSALVGGDIVMRKALHHVEMVTSTFENMTGASVGLFEQVSRIPHEQEVYLSLLPELMTQVGVIEHGVPVSYEAMQDRLRNEVLGISAYYDNPRESYGTTSLVVSASGNTLQETKSAVGWMNNVMMHPDWRVENLPRIRDVVDQALSGLRNTMQGSEESWVHNPADAFRHQTDRIYLATGSFLTRAFNAYRLRWLLKDGGDDATSAAVGVFLEKLARAGRESDREGVMALLHAMQGEQTEQAPLPEMLRQYMKLFSNLAPSAKAIAVDAAKDLEQNLVGVPDESLFVDWDFLCLQMRRDLHVPPAEVLRQLNEVRARIFHTEEAHLYFTGSSQNRAALDGDIRTIVAGLDTTRTWVKKFPSDSRFPVFPVDDTKLILHRYLGRTHGGAPPLFVGLVNPNTQSGVFLNSAYVRGINPTAGMKANDTRPYPESFLAAKLFSGHGSHSMFMKTWSAGLAYSNGLSSSATSERVGYYAERCPELPQTLGFVINELKNAPHDPALVEYAIAQVFLDSRAAESFESRGEGMARQVGCLSLAQDDIRNFRKSILDLRSKSDLANTLFTLMPQVYGSVLPGWNNKYLDKQDGVYFVIGPEKQMGLYEAYLKSTVGQDAVVHRLWPRDYWIAD